MLHMVIVFDITSLKKLMSDGSVVLILDVNDDKMRMPFDNMGFPRFLLGLFGNRFGNLDTESQD